MAKSTDVLMPPPEVVGLLPDKPGGETNLLPEALTRTDLKVWFTVPLYSDPTKGEEKVELFVDNNPNPLVVRTWDQPITDTDRYVLLPQHWLRANDGEHSLRYRATIYNGDWEYSNPLIMTLDTQAPTLATANALVFPPAVLPPNKLTAQYLAQNNDQVKAGIPLYTTPKPWDRITWYWSDSAGGYQQAGVIELDDKNYTGPLELVASGDLIRLRGNGARFVSYSVEDRAGNKTPYAVHVELNVDTAVVPRVLPPAKVLEASNSGSSGVLVPARALNGVTVELPATAVINDDERVVVCWAQPGTPGDYTTETPVEPGSRQYSIPKTRIAQHSGGSLTVTYEVHEPGVANPHKSQTYNLRVDDISGLPTVQCEEDDSGGNLSLKAVTDFANFTMENWSFMSTEQFVSVEVRGIDANMQTVVIPALVEGPVPEVAPKIPVGRISKADLQRFKLNERLEVRATVSFDGKRTWKRFDSLRPLLIA
ncbi:hypothetical protein [Pseudomonas sp. S2_C03]